MIYKTVLTKPFGHNIYVPDNVLHPRICTLAIFLTDDVGMDIQSWIDYALSSKIYKGGNASILEKNGDTIIIGDALHDDDEVRPDTLTMHKDDFIKMLLRWEELYKQQPAEIIITQDEQGKIAMIGTLKEKEKFGFIKNSIFRRIFNYEV